MNKNNFIKELSKLGVEISENQLNQLEKYYELLLKYNKIMNLTSIIERDQVYLKHFYDSLTIVKIIDLKNEKNLCDLGSGAGFPGIVLKILFPSLEITLVDSLNKRINFLNKVIQDLNLKQIKTVNARIEDYSKDNKEKYDVVTARAVAPLNILLELGVQLIKTGKYFIAMKGNIENEPYYQNAIEKLNCKEISKITFDLPYENSKRCLIKIKKIKSCSNLFPRKYSVIKKTPL